VTADRLAQMFAQQYEAQELFWGPLPDDRAKRRELAAHFAQELGGEVYEYLDAIAYKRFIPREEAPRGTRLLELVDIFKFWLCLCWTEGVSARELADAFDGKTRIVHDRWRERMESGMVAGFDLDGVLCEYGAWTPSEAEFIERGGCLTLKPEPGAKQLLEWLRSKGFSIVVITARKAHVHRRLEIDTFDWLEANELPVDRVLYGYDKSALMRPYGERFGFFVDDSPKHALDMAEAGVHTFHLDPFSNLSHKNIERVCDLASLRDRLETLYG
jgi:hypothetical protein